MAVKARISKSGQVTVPAEIREKLGLKPGDTVIWGEGPHGEATMRPVKYTFEELCGILGPLPEGVSVDGLIREATGDAIDRRYRRWREQGE